MADSEEQGQPYPFILMPDGQTLMTQAQLDAMPQAQGFLVTGSVSFWRIGSFSATWTSDKGFYWGPGVGGSYPPISFAAGATIGGPPSSFANESSYLLGAGLR